MRPKKVEGYDCPVCDDFHVGTPEESGSYRIEMDELEGPEDEPARYLTELPELVGIFVCESGEILGEDSPLVAERYQCGECEELYEDREEAKECCK
ncbi:MAG: hypothetical protein ACYCSN_19800 [Acidobacteriaceae bacterium]